MELGYTPISLCTLRNSSIIFAIQMMIFPFSFVFFLERYIFKIKFSRHYLLNKLNLLITRIERVQISMEINRNILMFQECLKFINYYSTKNTQNFVLLMKIDNQSESHELFEPRRFRSKHRAYNRWTLEQNQEYINFLGQFKRDFDREHTRRVTKVFKRLSEFMKTKSESQCKSHHQKMLQQYGSIENVISHFLQRLETERHNPKKPRQTSKPKLNDQNQDRSQCAVDIKKKVTQIAEIIDHDKSTKSTMNITSIGLNNSEDIQEQLDNIISFNVFNVKQTLFDVLNQEAFMNH